jgi:hypothetical protein
VWERTVQINFVYDTSTSTAPAAFQTALNSAASILDALITNPITLNIRVGWGEVWGVPLSNGALAEGGPSAGTTMSYGQTQQYLSAVAGFADAKNTTANLGAMGNVTSSQMKAWGLVPANGTGIDGAIGFMPVAEDYNYDVSDRDAAGGYDLIGVAIHEITHAMGRLAGDSAFQMVDYFSPGVMNTLLSGIGGYFSVDGGKTGLASFALSDLADWSNQAGDEANAIAFPGLVNSISDIDKLMMRALGFGIAAAPVPTPTPTPVPTPTPTPVPTPTPTPVPTPTPTPVPTPTPTPPVPPTPDPTPAPPTPTPTPPPTPDPTPGTPAAPTPPATNFTIHDPTHTWTDDGTVYSGPAQGVQHQYINVTSAGLAITAAVPSSFIHTGSGDDAIDVRQASGTNVLDGSTGSNFLAGGSGNDTFFVDDRGASADIWSSIVNFHAGDHVTVWGVTAADFALAWQNGQGAAGNTGLTGSFTKAGVPRANVTLVGYTTADIGNRLAVSFGATADQPGAPGSVFMSLEGR